MIADRLMFIGNSITYRAPAIETYDWHYAWGMAATQANYDYVHIIHQAITAYQGYAPETKIISSAPSLPPELADDIVDFVPDILVVQWGEAALIGWTQQQWLDAYAPLGEAATEVGAIAIAVGMWYTHTVVGDPRGIYLENAAEAAGMIYVPFSDLHTVPNEGGVDGFAHPGVANHPGNAGMKELAHRLMRLILDPTFPKVQSSGRCVPVCRCGGLKYCD